MKKGKPIISNIVDPIRTASMDANVRNQVIPEPIRTNSVDASGVRI